METKGLAVVMEYASPFSVIDTIAIIPTKRKTPWGIGSIPKFV